VEVGMQGWKNERVEKKKKKKWMNIWRVDLLDVSCEILEH
jgi:hypothetical protein